MSRVILMAPKNMCGLTSFLRAPLAQRKNTRNERGTLNSTLFEGGNLTTINLLSVKDSWVYIWPNFIYWSMCRGFWTTFYLRIRWDAVFKTKNVEIGTKTQPVIGMLSLINIQNIF